MAVFKSIYVKAEGVITSKLDNSKTCKDLLRQIVNSLDYTILKESFVNFKPQGLTGVLILGESHISIHTWPEKNIAVLGMLTCKRFEAREGRLLRNIVREALGPKKLSVKTID